MSPAPNRLAREPSPYLRQHAGNPVDWYPWGEEALERARREDRPIHLSIGYSACHWCHVMAHECFEDPEIARQMNDWFVNVKLDRQERPDLDQLYQGVVQLMGRGGGWPLTVFLTPELKPFFGGTYFPPEDRHGLPGFPRILRSLHEAWVNRRAEVEEQARAFSEGLSMIASYGLEASPEEAQPEDVALAARYLAAEVNSSYGGFGNAPKFPNPSLLALLLRGWRRTRDSALLARVTLTLERMAEGGIYDQLGGGFHRYSVDERWLVPHFEKMLYDNAQLIHLYAEAMQAEPRPLWRRVVEQTVEYVGHELTSPEGAFFSAQDADSEGEEGKYFVWTAPELDALLPPEEARLARAHFGVTEGGGMERGRNVLTIARRSEQLAQETGKPIEQVEVELGRIRRTMLQARGRRVPPDRDDQVLSGWNGLMIHGLSLASRAFGRPEWAVLATRAADFILEQRWRGGVLLRTSRDGAAGIHGFLEDYGAMASGLAALFQATFEPRYLEAAEAIADRAFELFWDAERGAYLAAPRGQGDLLRPLYALHDGAVPSGASMLAEAQVTISSLTGRTIHFERVGAYLRRLRAEALRSPFAFSHLWLAADGWLEGGLQVTLAGEGADLEALLAVVDRIYAPTLAVAVRRSGEIPRVLASVLEGREPLQGRAAAYLCRGFACRPPVSEPEELRRLLE
ncbi:MAG: thioredoxin domain-containing protein [Myxococcales bacterium]|nr:thioredoxin domain-containing protein [Myxococcales bacterium]